MPAARLLPIGVLISGQGTNLEAILRRCETGSLDATVRCVISNRADAPGLRHGRARGLATHVHEREAYASRVEQQRAMRSCLVDAGVELVVLAGFDQILGPEFVGEASYRIVNVHPSLLPAFGGGMHAVRDALAYGAKVTGCTVHFVVPDCPGTDAGPIILQEPVAILEDDTEASLLARVHEAEHRLLPEAIQLVAEGRLRIEGRHVHILGNEVGVRG